MTQTLIQVALGGAIGATGRYLVNMGALRLIGPGFPAGTLAVNVLGSFLMGVMFVLLMGKGDGARVWSPFLMTGILGGFTTFSAFSLDALTLYERGQPTMAAAYVLASVMLSILALMAGVALARGIWP